MKYYTVHYALFYVGHNSQYYCELYVNWHSERWDAASAVSRSAVTRDRFRASCEEWSINEANQSRRMEWSINEVRLPF